MGIVVVVVLLLVIMPALIYFIGWGVTRFVKKAPARRGLTPSEGFRSSPGLPPLRGADRKQREL